MLGRQFRCHLEQRRPLGRVERLLRPAEHPADANGHDPGDHEASRLHRRQGNLADIGVDPVG